MKAKTTKYWGEMINFVSRFLENLGYYDKKSK